jgi:hypothetical protein
MARQHIQNYKKHLTNERTNGHTNNLISNETKLYVTSFYAEINVIHQFWCFTTHDVKPRMFIKFQSN